VDITSFKIFWALCYKEMVVFRSDYFRVLINSLFFTVALLIPLMFFLPMLGIRDDYAQFMLPAQAMSWGMFDIMANATSFISDIVGDKVIEHELSLPISQWAIFVKIALANAYRSFVISIFIIPTGSIVLYLGKGFIFSQIDIPKMILMLVLTNLCFGFLGLFAASYMKKVSDIRNVWMRVIFPMWWIGAFNTSWATIFEGAPKLAVVLLLNPIVYMAEGIRVATLGQEGFINYWICVGVLLIFTTFFGIIAVLRFKKRLDCI